MRFCGVADGGRAFCGFPMVGKSFIAFSNGWKNGGAWSGGAFRADGRQNSRFNAKNAEGLTQRNAKNSRETGGRRAGGADTRRPRNLGSRVSRLGGDASPHGRGRAMQKPETCGGGGEGTNRRMDEPTKRKNDGRTGQRAGDCWGMRHLAAFLRKGGARGGQEGRPRSAFLLFPLIQGPWRSSSSRASESSCFSASSWSLWMASASLENSFLDSHRMPSGESSKA